MYTTMDFQSRVNQFRQNMDDQQSNYNKMAATASNFGRTVLPDKTAAHYAYMEQVSGITTGAFASYHGGVKMFRRVQKMRKAKAAKNTTGKTTQEDLGTDRAADTQQEASAAENQSSVRATQEAPAEPIESLDISEEADTAASRAKGMKPGAEERSIDDDPSVVGQGENDFHPDSNVSQGNAFTNEDVSKALNDEVGFAKNEGESSYDHIQRFTQDLPEGGGAEEGGAAPPAPPAAPEPPARAPSEDEIRAADPDVDDLGSGAGSGNVTGAGGADVVTTEGSGGGVRIGQTAPEPRPGAPEPNQRAVTGPAEDADVVPSVPGEGGDIIRGGANIGSTITSGADEASGALQTIKEGVQSAGRFAGRVLGGGADAIEAVGQAAKSGAARVIGEAGAEVASEAVPFLGEAVGLGMLIDNIVKAHKHEENAGPPQLTAAAPEAQEQAGGIDTGMLKMSSAPSIY